jgi:hypothetical protein
MSALGQEGSFRPGQPNVRFPPIADLHVHRAPIPTRRQRGDSMHSRSRPKHDTKRLHDDPQVKENVVIFHIIQVIAQL